MNILSVENFSIKNKLNFLGTKALAQIQAMPALWIKHFPNGEILLLQYSDDFIYVGDTNTAATLDFVTALKAHFEVEVAPRATWYLQARIDQESDGNITHD